MKGWRCIACRASNAAEAAGCENCGVARPGPPAEAGAGAGACAGCRAPQPARQLTAGEDGQRRCASCHVASLRARRADPTERCEDGATVAEKVAEFRRLVAGPAWAERFATRREEPRAAPAPPEPDLGW